MHPTTTFVDRAAAEAWDAWFRRRDGTRLRDTTIEATWQRVAGAICDGARPRLRPDLLATMASWRILLDERIIATVGTVESCWPADPWAVVNAAVFVREPATLRARFDAAAFADSAGIALHALDAAIAHARPAALPAQPRIGVIGVADALALLGLRYASADALVLVREIGRSLAEGCFAASIALARERGASTGLTQGLRARAVGRGIAGTLVADAQRHGLLHTRVTALGAHPRLALLANNVADALDPLRVAEHQHVFPPDGRRIASAGYARTLAGPTGSAATRDTIECVPALAQIALRGALQPWLDAPIDHPLRVARLPSGEERMLVRNEAARQGLGDAAWSLADALPGIAARL